MKMRFGLVALLTAGLVLTAQGAAGQGDKNPATTPAPRMGKGDKPDVNWIKRHNGFTEAIAKNGKDAELLFLGDSITDAWRGKAAQPTWNKYFAPYKALNFGIGGDRTQHVLWRLQHGELEGFRPKVAVLMIGTNNTGSDSAEQIAAGVTAIVKEIHKQSPNTKVLLLAIFPRPQGRQPAAQEDRADQ